jgi:hypothetical protein
MIQAGCRRHFIEQAKFDSMLFRVLCVRSKVKQWHVFVQIGRPSRQYLSTTFIRQSPTLYSLNNWRFCYVCYATSLNNTFKNATKLFQFTHGHTSYFFHWLDTFPHIILVSAYLNTFCFAVKYIEAILISTKMNVAGNCISVGLGFAVRKII